MEDSAQKTGDERDTNRTLMDLDIRTTFLSANLLNDMILCVVSQVICVCNYTAAIEDNIIQ